MNKNAFAEINYGTGRDVSGEDIHDASVPLVVRWLTSSYIDVRESPVTSEMELPTVGK